MRKISALSELSADRPLYICPACNAAEKLYRLINKYCPDIRIAGFLDNYKDTERCGLTISRIESPWDSEPCNVVVAIEREDIRKSLLRDLEGRNVHEIVWVEGDFSFAQERGIEAQERRLRFVYDLRTNPLNYEFVVSLCHADVERRLRALETMEVVIVKQAEEKLFDISRNAIKEASSVVESDNDWFMHNVIIPSCALLPAVDSVSVVKDLDVVNTLVSTTPGEYLFPSVYSVGQPVEIQSARKVFEKEYATNGEHHLPITAPDSAIHLVQQWLQKRGYTDKRIVAITLREASYQHERNSVQKVWKAFADYLVENGYLPVFVRDTFADFVNDDFSAYPVFHEASWNVLLRVAFYEQAYMNMLINTGPAAFCVFNRRTRYILFNHVADEGYVGSPQYHTDSGSPVGSQYAARMPYQQAVWGGTDSLDVIIEEFEKACKRLETACDTEQEAS